MSIYQKKLFKKSRLQLYLKRIVFFSNKRILSFQEKIFTILYKKEFCLTFIKKKFYVTIFIYKKIFQYGIYYYFLKENIL